MQQVHGLPLFVEALKCASNHVNITTAHSRYICKGSLHGSVGSGVWTRGDVIAPGRAMAVALKIQSTVITSLEEDRCDRACVLPHEHKSVRGRPCVVLLPFPVHFFFFFFVDTRSPSCAVLQNPVHSD